MSSEDAFITGIGQSEVGMKLIRSPLLLTLDAVREALADAGLGIDQIDGVSTYPGRTPTLLGFSPVGADELIDVAPDKIKDPLFAGLGPHPTQCQERDTWLVVPPAGQQRTPCHQRIRHP